MGRSPVPSKSKRSHYYNPGLAPSIRTRLNRTAAAMTSGDKPRSDPADASTTVATGSPSNHHLSDEHKYVYFWKPEQEHGWASQWHPEPFKGASNLPGRGEPAEVIFNTAEHWMMYHKAALFEDFEIAKEVLRATNPSAVKVLGRRVRGFDDRKWDEHRCEIVLAGSLAKFRSSALCREKLLGTGDKILVEASPFDRVWGIGFTRDNAYPNRDKWGLNLLGNALMEARNIIRNENRGGEEGKGESKY